MYSHPWTHPCCNCVLHAKCQVLCKRPKSIVGKCHLDVLQVRSSLTVSCKISSLWMGAFAGHHFVSSRRINPFRQISCHTTGPKMDMQHPKKENIMPSQITTSVVTSFLELRRQIKGCSKSLKTDCSVHCSRSLGGMQNDHKKELQHYMKANWTFFYCVFLWSTVGLHI